jgi:cob(I)alamin adenosyltransferase
VSDERSSSPRIYTKRGDAGETGLFDGSRVSKHDARVDAYGEVDELNATLGLARSLLSAEGGDLDAELEGLQRDLFALGALLADPRRDGEDPSSREPDDRLALREQRVADLEALIDRWEAELPPLRNFILPAGVPAAAALHVSRTVTRRAERALTPVVLGGAGHPVALRYLNRLSDLLFVAARLANARCGDGDEPW